LKTQHKIDHLKCNAFHDPWIWTYYTEHQQTPLGHALKTRINTEVPIRNNTQAKQLSQKQAEEEKSETFIPAGQ